MTSASPNSAPSVFDKIDSDLEFAIHNTALAMSTAVELEDRRALWNKLQALHKSRRAAYVKQMEIDRGLR